MIQLMQSYKQREASMNEKNKDTELTKEDKSIAKQKIKEFLRGNNRLLSGFGGTAILKAIATVADKLSRDNDGNFKPGWFYTYVTAHLLSGPGYEIMTNYMKQRQLAIENSIKDKMHREFDNFSIAERKIRANRAEELINDTNIINRSTTGYLSSKINLASNIVATGVLIGATVASGGVASLPIMGGVIAASALTSQFLNRRTVKGKIEAKNEIRKAASTYKITDRQMYVNSYQREIADKENKAYDILNKERKALEDTSKSFTKFLNKYARIEALIKATVMGGVIAATISNPANALVTFGAAMGSYAAVDRCIDSYYSLKEHIGNFAHAYKNFIPRLKVKYGKEKIKNNADTIELDHITVKRRTENDPLTPSDKTLFTSNETLHIKPGITILSGASGAGKSTLIDLMLHSNDVDGGTIRIGTMENNKFVGTDYSELAFAEPGKHIALSMQKPSFIEMSVDEYIRLGNPDAPEELVKKVKDLVGIKNRNDTNQELSPEYIPSDKIINAVGSNISGGQANRLSLAQALIKDSPILILDEPTAGVDNTMSNNIINHLNSIKDHKTIIYITHEENDIEMLNTDLALDIGKDPDKKSSTIAQYDLSDPKVKQEYLKFFTDRNIGRSPSSPEKPMPNKEENLSRIKKLRKIQTQKNKPNTQNNIKSDNTYYNYLQRSEHELM